MDEWRFFLYAQCVLVCVCVQERGSDKKLIWRIKFELVVKSSNENCPNNRVTNQMWHFVMTFLLKSLLQTLSNGSRIQGTTISSRLLFILRERTCTVVSTAYSVQSCKKIDKMSDLEELWKTLQEAVNSKSLLKKHLTPARYERLKSKKTKFGGTLADCIRSGKKIKSLRRWHFKSAITVFYFSANSSCTIFRFPQ